MEDLGLSNVNTANHGADTIEDINSLLPGLESFVDAPGDNSTNNASNNDATASALDSGIANAGNGQNRLQAAPDNSLDHSSFDDLFGSTDLNLDGQDQAANGLDLGTDFTGEFDEFNDDWFKM